MRLPLNFRASAVSQRKAEMDNISGKRKFREAILLYKEPAEIFKNVAEISAFLLAGLWAVWLFHYQDRVLPAKVHLHIVAKSTLEVIGERGDLLAVRARVNVANNSKVQARILGAWFNMRAYAVADNHGGVPPESAEKQIRTQTGEEFIDLPRQATINDGEIINSGRLMQVEWWLEPDEEQAIEFVTFVPKKFDLVRLKCHFRVAKEFDKPDILSREWVVNKDGSIFLEFYVKDANGKRETYDPTKKGHRDLFKDNMPLIAYTTSYAVLWKEQMSLTASPSSISNNNHALRDRSR